MIILDKNGRLFGKINIIDFIILSLIFSFIGGATFVYKEHTKKLPKCPKCEECVECVECECEEVYKELEVLRDNQRITIERLTKDMLYKLHNKGKLMVLE